jgi:hypothetical protein
LEKLNWSDRRRSWWPIQALTIERRQGDAIIPESAALSASTARPSRELCEPVAPSTQAYQGVPKYRRIRKFGGKVVQTATQYLLPIYPGHCCRVLECNHGLHNRGLPGARYQDELRLTSLEPPKLWGAVSHDTHRRTARGARHHPAQAPIGDDAPTRRADAGVVEPPAIAPAPPTNLHSAPETRRSDRHRPRIDKKGHYRVSAAGALRIFWMAGSLEPPSTAARWRTLRWS